MDQLCVATFMSFPHIIALFQKSTKNNHNINNILIQSIQSVKIFKTARKCIYANFYK